MDEIMKNIDQYEDRAKAISIVIAVLEAWNVIKVYDEQTDQVQYVATFAGIVISGIRWNDPTGAMQEETEVSRDVECQSKIQDCDDVYRDRGYRRPKRGTGIDGYNNRPVRPLRDES